MQCKCIDPKNQGGKPACGSPKYKGDGNCDDNNNNKGCGYDGGDCCAKTVKGGKVQKDYCKMAGNGPTTQGSAALVLDRPVACCHKPFFSHATVVGRSKQETPPVRTTQGP